jgi:hypothetical protein
MVRALPLVLGVIGVLVLVFIVFAVLGTILHFLFLALIVAAVGFVTLRAARSRPRNRD